MRQNVLRSWLHASAVKPACILVFGVGIGAVACAMFLWMPEHSHTESNHPGPAALPMANGDNRPARAHSLTPAIVRTKLRQWRNTAIGEATTHEAITQELVGMLSDDHTAGIVQLLSPQELHTPFGNAAVKLWLDIAPAEAASWLATRADATEHQASLVARRFEESPDALHVYCDQLPASAWKEQVLQHASLNMADIDPTQAITFAQRLVPGAAQSNAFETIAYAWFGRDPTAALRWVQTVADAKLRVRLFAVGAKAIARVDPDLGLD